MKISYQWLKDWVNISLPAEELAEQLTLSGLEVEECLPVADEFTGVVVAEVKNVEQHPQAEKLKICQVDAGDGQAHTVVCAAQNVTAGVRVPYARVGAKLQLQTALPKNIEAASLRGVMSAGMLCSAADLGMAESSEGLLLLPQDAPLGKDIRDYLQLDDTVIDVQLTPNRGDCLSLLGIAREVGALKRVVARDLRDLPDVAEFKNISVTSIPDTFPVNIKAEQACWSYTGRVIKNVNNNIPSPIWMQERLRRGGIRSISVVVDIMNYVMLEVGQPLHAFDLNLLHDEITVRYAEEGEVLTLLNNQTINLTTNSLVIADSKAPVALAGVMGGLDSAVANSTADIFIESAFFTPDAISGRARQYGLQTDGAYRWERGVDPLLHGIALERASMLVVALAGGSIGPVTDVTTKANMAPEKLIELSAVKLERVLGVALPAAEVVDILQRLGMKVASLAQGTVQGWQVTVPSFRFDMALPEDVIEEVARVYGYINLPTTIPKFNMALPEKSLQQKLTAEKFAQVLVDRGYQEVITYSFVDPVLQKMCDPEREALPLLNPIASDLAVMRTNLWPGLLSTLQYNVNRQQERARCFEHGLCFIPTEKELLQVPRLAGLTLGSMFAEKWHPNVFDNDFYTLKADVLALLALTHDSTQFQILPGQHPALHPGQTGIIKTAAGITVGYIGAVHPRILQSVDIKNSVYGFELMLDALTTSKLPRYVPLSPFPRVRRDLAFVMQQSVLAEEILNTAKQVAGSLLVELTIFDVYQGTGIPDGYKSLALGLTLQHPQRTLTDAEVEALIQDVIAAMHQQFAAELRK